MSDKSTLLCAFISEKKCILNRDRESQVKVSSEIDAKQGIAQYTWKVAQLKRKDTMLELSKEVYNLFIADREIDSDDTIV